MSFLNSYSFGIVDGHNEIPEKVLRLFDSEDFSKTDCTCEVLTAGLNGKIDFNRPFNLMGYNITVHNNQELKKKERNKREVSVEQCLESINGSNDDASTNRDAYEYASYLMFKRLEDEYDKLNDADELRDAIEQIKGLRSYIASNYGFDIIIAIRQALNYIPESLSLIKNLCENDNTIAEYIKIILSSNYSFSELFA